MNFYSEFEKAEKRLDKIQLALSCNKVASEEKVLLLQEKKQLMSDCKVASLYLVFLHTSAYY